MFFRVLLFAWEFALDLLATLGMTADQKDWEILLLRQQLRIAVRQQIPGSRIPCWQKVSLVALVIQLKAKATNSKQVLLDTGVGNIRDTQNL